MPMQPVAHLSVNSGNELRCLNPSVIPFQTSHTRNAFTRSDPKRLAETLTTETEESCTTYNMLKVPQFVHGLCNVPASIFI
jgi:hypothetical protein